MQKWEYLRLQVVYSEDGIDHITVNGLTRLGTVHYASHTALHQYIQDLGTEGWEMVSNTLDNSDEILYFKRPIA